MTKTEKNIITTCDYCERPIYEGDDYTTTYSGAIYCEHCVDELIEFDGDYYNVDQCIYTRDDGYVPQWYADDYYFYCDDCQEYVHTDYYHEANGYAYCDDCYDKHASDMIHDYHCVPSFEPKRLYNEKETTRMVGFELETEPTGYTYYTRDMLETITDNLACYLEHDGSLDSGGFEIVTQPMTINYLLSQRDSIRVALDTLRANDYGTNGGAGLHVHVTRPTENNDEIIQRIWLILETYKDEIIALSGRHSTGWASFVSDHINTNKQSDNVFKKCMVSTEYIKENDDVYCERYMALNNTNYKTIEYRLFDHTTSIRELYARIELVYNITAIASDLSIDLTTINFNDIIHFDKRFDDLIAYADEIGAYNDTKIVDNTLLYRAYKKRQKDRQKLIENAIRKMAISLKTSTTRNTHFDVDLKAHDTQYYIDILNTTRHTIQECDRLLYQLDTDGYGLYDYIWCMDTILRQSNVSKYFKTKIQRLIDNVRGCL